MERLLAHFFEKLIRDGALTVHFPSGRRIEAGDGTGNPVAIRFKSAADVRKFLANPELAFGELYMDGGLTIEQGALYDAIDMAIRNLALASRPGWLKLLGRFRIALRGFRQSNTPRSALANIARHYDLDGRLYDLFLDSDRQYSCAYFTSPGQTLEDAQRAKKRHIAAKLLIGPGMGVLDIGCGWGGMALYLAGVCGADAEGITLSQEQFDMARARAAKAGLSRQARFRLTDYREIAGTFDRIVSVGMFEHVGVTQFKTYFQTIADRLAGDGVALVHSIGRTDGPGETNPWITKYIFPGGYIPALSEIVPAAEKAGLIVTDVEVLRLHYAETLKAWRERFESHRGEAAALYDERFCRMWEFYLISSECTFRQGLAVVFQLQLAKSPGTVPITRDYIAAAEAGLREREAGMARDGRQAAE